MNQQKVKEIAEMGVYPGDLALSELRSRRGLKKNVHISRNCSKFTQDVPRNYHACFTAMNLPVIIPISEEAFGGKPQDWGPNCIFTVRSTNVIML